MWKSILDSMPLSGTTVWIRVLDVYSKPIKATAQGTAINLNFSIVGTGLKIPAYQVARWRNL